MARFGAATIGAAGLLAAALGGAAADPAISPGDVISVLRGDWNGDGGMDRAVLALGPEDADLYVYLSGAGAREMVLAAEARALVWSGAMGGTYPDLARSAAGGIVVMAQNSAIGRARWQERLTLAYRGGAFLVAGYTYEDHDTLDPGAGTSCDVNLLTGRAIRDGRELRLPPRRISVADWSGAVAREICPVE